MTFIRLYEYACSLKQYPVILEGVLDAKACEFASQDELYYVPVELDLDISRGHIKQYRIPRLYGDPSWVTEIRYHQGLNVCWRRYVCCKELMHVFDAADERANSPEKFRQLLDEIEAPIPSPSGMYQSETRTMWMALAVLVPEPVRNHFRALHEAKAMSPYEIALSLRIPEDLIRAAFSERYDKVLASLKN